jgi:hypothetical protein
MGRVWISFWAVTMIVLAVGLGVHNRLNRPGRGAPNFVRGGRTDESRCIRHGGETEEKGKAGVPTVGLRLVDC